MSIIPVIDLAKPDANVQRALADACREVGFFYVKNHGIPASHLTELMAFSKSFFSLEKSEKEKIHFSNGNFRRGYVPIKAENTDTSKTGDLKEAYDFTFTNYEEGENLFLPAFQKYQAAVERYNQDMCAPARRIFFLFTNSLNLPADFYEDKIDQPMTSMRLIHYPPQKIDFEKTQGIGAHTDYECLTLLAQDSVGGLEIQSLDGKWIEATPIENTFVVNVGEMLSLWTNGLYRATPHRVINKSGVERFSVPFFFSANKNTEISKGIQAGEYLKERVYSVIVEK